MGTMMLEQLREFALRHEGVRFVDGDEGFVRLAGRGWELDLDLVDRGAGERLEVQFQGSPDGAAMSATMIAYGIAQTAA